MDEGDQCEHVWHHYLFLRNEGKVDGKIEICDNCGSMRTISVGGR